MISRGGWDFPGFPGEDYPPPTSITINGKEVKAGSRVRLCPKKRRADAFDAVLDGKTATVEVIHQDFENRVYLVVTADNDPALELMQMQSRIMPGHLFFFFPEEVEPLENESDMSSSVAPLEPTKPVEGKPKRILIACIGNIFLGDDGFGVEVARRLQSREYPESVQVVDIGIRGMDLAYTLLDDYYTLILVDAVPRGGQPGTLYLIEPDVANINAEQGAEAGRAALDTHSMDPVKVLAYARTLGARAIRTLLVGCEPTPVSGNSGYEEMQMGLSTPVQAAIDEAVKMIDSLIEQLLAA